MKKKSFGKWMKKNLWTIVKMIFLLAVSAAGFWAIATYVPDNLMNGYHGRLSLSILWGAITVVYVSRLITSRASYWICVALFSMSALFFFALAAGEIKPDILRVFENTDVIILIAPVMAAMILLLNALKVEQRT